jgi:hypothetical protein
MGFSLRNRHARIVVLLRAERTQRTCCEAPSLLARVAIAEKDGLRLLESQRASGEATARGSGGHGAQAAKVRRANHLAHRQTRKKSRRSPRAAAFGTWPFRSLAPCCSP